MSNVLHKTSFVVLLCIYGFFANAQLQITSQTNAQALAQRLVGDGITISNVQLTGSSVSSGFFRNLGGNNIGLDSGIVLSSGRVLTSGFNYGMDGASINLASNINSTPGDAQLDVLVSPQQTNDAIYLEFDFIPIGDTVKFNYVFSSDEYPTFNCSGFNDVFAFFLSGPGIVGMKNLAVVPGTNIPVSINSINSGIPGSLYDIATCNAAGPGAPFTQYFTDNAGNLTFTHNGHTKILTAISAVQPCQTYHLKIAIADVSDESYDSGVFLQAKSLVSTPLEIINQNPVANGIPYLVEGCTNGSIVISRTRKQSFPQSINLFFAGNAVNGTDVQTIPSSVIIPANDSTIMLPITSIADNIMEGVEELKIYISYTDCGLASNFYADSITINLRDQLEANATVLTTSCTANNGSITINVTPNTGAAPYQYSINGGSFTSSNMFPDLAAGTYIVNVKDTSGCIYNITSVVNVDNTLVVSASPSDISICAGGSFQPQLTSSSSAASFSWTPSSGVSAPPLPGDPVTLNVGQQNTQFIVTGTLGVCTSKDTINVSVFTGATASAGPDVSIIQGDQVVLQASGSQGTYLWTPNTGLSASNVLNPSASPQQTTTYTLQVTSTQGCTATDQVTVVVVPYCVKPMEAFTPNGDGVNDRWLVTNGNCSKEIRAEVFNRYGHRVFQDNSYSNNWDGTYKGKPLPDGTYYFVITYRLLNNKLVYQKGNVTILR